MYRRLVLVLAACAAIFLVREPEADPCGVKLNIKAPRVKKQPDRSTNPSQILLLGDPPRALSKELSGRGHKVEVAGSADEARRVKYHAIVADPDHEEEAKSRWPGALVVVRRGSAKADANLVERELGASPTRTLVARTPERTSRDERTPIRTGPPREEDRGAPVAAGGGAASADRSVSASGGGSVEASVSAGTDAPAATPPKRVATVDTSARDTAEAEAVEETESARRPGQITKRVYFANSSADLSSRARARLMRNAKWLKRHADSSVVVEGHASVTGPPEPNQALSEARARVVKEFLVEQGVEDSRIETQAFGFSKPEFKPAWSSKNRRVVIKFNK
jgi:outer membrane protein OmpA-like peptidoglycan-associated protein